MLRSDAVTQGISRSPNRAMLRAVGFGDADFGKPIIGIANGYSTITPVMWGRTIWRCELNVSPSGRRHAPDLRNHHRHDGISMGTEAKSTSVSREVIADAIETACNGRAWMGCSLSVAATKTCPVPCSRWPA